ncbi:MAG TPA: FAD:protein FMN transferase, partial [Rectinemataceae bacterium]|nr:FAD:protein FMN transferase [Rectinemataceae bacterium]
MSPARSAAETGAPARRLLLAAAALSIATTALALGSCARKSPVEHTRTDFVLGTVCTIRLAEGGSESLLDSGFALLRHIEDELSVNKPGSQIDAVNAAAGKHPVAVGADALAIIQRDLHYSQITDGAFDASVGPLVKLWGIGTDHARLPSVSEIKQARSLVGWKDVVVDAAAGTIFLRRPGMALDLGSGTKGYATDQLVTLFAGAGVRSAVIDLGGNIFVMGSRPDGKPWRVGLQNPDNSERGSYIGIASLVNRTMVTSGVYERFFIQDGKRYHHILDPFTGYPVDNGLTSVTVIADKSFDADGFTTALFAVGRERGMGLAKEAGVDVI